MTGGQLLKKISAKQLFLADSTGALLTALLTGFVLPRFYDVFGMPTGQLYILSAVAFVLCLYSLLCHLFARTATKQLMLGIAMLNFLYCVTTITFVIYNRSTITTLGWLYFAGEVLIILTLVYAELKKAHQIR